MKRRAYALAALLGLTGGFPVAASEVREVYKRVKSAVVVVETVQKDVSPQIGAGLVDVGGLGSGVLISKDGQVLTAAHVVQAANRIAVRFMSGESIPARVLTSEPGADVALLQLERRPAIAHVATLADSDKVEVGDPVFVVGAPLALEHSLTVGHVSQRRVDSQVFGGLVETEMFQTDAAINQGNSGGPMFNMNGEVIGVVSHIISQGGGFEGLGFVITSNMARRLLLEGTSFWSGIDGLLLAGEAARVLNVPGGRGLLVQRVADRSFASHLGVQAGTVPATIGGGELILGGDVIIEAFGVPLSDPQARPKIQARIKALEDGAEITLKVLRAGEVVELKNYYFPHILVPEKPGEEDD